MIVRRFLGAVALTTLALTVPALAALSVGSKAPNLHCRRPRAEMRLPSISPTRLRRPASVLLFRRVYDGLHDRSARLCRRDRPVQSARCHRDRGVARSPRQAPEVFRQRVPQKFPVAADTNQSVEKAYDSVLAQHPQYANRTSYVIAPDGTIVYTYTSLDPSLHVENTLGALKTWESEPLQAIANFFSGEPNQSRAPRIEGAWIAYYWRPSPYWRRRHSALPGPSRRPSTFGILPTSRRVSP